IYLLRGQPSGGPERAARRVPCEIKKLQPNWSRRVPVGRPPIHSVTRGVSPSKLGKLGWPWGLPMTKREQAPSWFSKKATAILLFIILLPFAVVGLSWVFDYVSKRM